jgi:hypothetical protein
MTASGTGDARRVVDAQEPAPTAPPPLPPAGARPGAAQPAARQPAAASPSTPAPSAPAQQPIAPASGTHRVGFAPGQSVLGSAPAGAGAVKRDLASGADVLPEIVEAEIKPRPMWKHPAFIVSIILTFLALAGAAVWFILSIVMGGQARIASAQVTIDGGNAHITWTPTDFAADVFVVTGADVVDVSEGVTPGELWLPVGLGQYRDESCFVVRPAELGDTPVSLGAADLEAQGAASACVADAGSAMEQDEDEEEDEG